MNTYACISRLAGHDFIVPPALDTVVVEETVASEHHGHWDFRASSSIYLRSVLRVLQVSTQVMNAPISTDIPAHMHPYLLEQRALLFKVQGITGDAGRHVAWCVHKCVAYLGGNFQRSE